MERDRRRSRDQGLAASYVNRHMNEDIFKVEGEMAREYTETLKLPGVIIYDPMFKIRVHSGL